MSKRRTGREPKRTTSNSEADWFDQVAQLRADVEGLRAALADEVRTRRVVVEDEHGNERVLITGGQTYGSVCVRALDPPQDGVVTIELFAVDSIDADPPEVGLAITVGGTTVPGMSLSHASADSVPSGGSV